MVHNKQYSSGVRFYSHNGLMLVRSKITLITPIGLVILLIFLKKFSDGNEIIILKETISTKRYYHQEMSQLDNLVVYQEMYHLL